MDAQHQHLRELAESIHEVFWLTDATYTKMLYVSPAYERIFGRSCAALYADVHDWLAALHLEDRARLAAFVASPPSASRSERFRIVHGDGSVRTVDVTVFPIYEGGAVVRVAGVTQDITERLLLEEQVRQTQKLESLGLLAGGVAHDFNNILAVIAANASFVSDAVPQIGPERDALNEIMTAVQRGVALTRQLLSFSRKDAIEPTVLDLNAAVNDTRKMLLRMVGEDVVITTTLDPDLGRVKIDAGCLVQILMNLAVNARDAMPRGGSLLIATRNLEHEVMIAMTDTGCGMTEEVKRRAFEPLFTTKAPGKGTGLGLSVVHRIVEQAGGRIEVDSAPGAGTTFRVVLPLHTGPEAQSIKTPPKDGRGCEKVVIVDDDAYVRASISRALRRQGYDVLEAGDGPSALQLMVDQGRRIDLLVTDIVMPGMDGCELASAARRQRPTLQILYITGYTDDAVMRHGVERAAVDLLEKPFHSDTLAARVRQILDDACMRRPAKSA
ncbi:MAG TPA: response regulator [Kofleriaceae bacterium]|nr:response regulator [Kofleriaceae bacterium]